MRAAASRILDTRVRCVPAVSYRESALAVAHDNAERPVHDRRPVPATLRESRCSIMHSPVNSENHQSTKIAPRCRTSGATRAFKLALNHERSTAGLAGPAHSTC